MYGWIWRHLPGPLAVRIVCSVALLAVVAVVLFTVVFPWAESMLPFLNVTVDQP